jgi:hypothetical protein
MVDVVVRWNKKNSSAEAELFSVLLSGQIIVGMI